MPAGAGGTISLAYQPAAIYHGGIVASALALLLLLAFASTRRLRRRRPGTDPPDRPAPPDSHPVNELMAGPARSEPISAAAGALAPDTQLHAWTGAAARVAIFIPLAAVIVVAGGPIVIAVPVLAVIDSWRPRWRPAIAVCAMLAVGVTAATARTPTSVGSGPFSGTAQVLALVALAAALLPVVSGTPGWRWARQRRSRLPRRAFTAPDELTCYFDSLAEPSNIHLEMRVPGRLDPHAFRVAAAAALMANPRASSRRAAHRLLSGSYAWEHPGNLDIDPVAFTTFADAAELAAKRTEFISRSPAIDVSPPAQLLVASGPDCDHVLLNAHHATMDGLSWLDLLRDIGRRYRASTGLDPDSSAGGPLTTTGDGASFAGQGPGQATLRRTRLPGQRPARIASERGGRRGYGVHLTLLPGLPAVRPFADGTKATLNEALITALIVAIGRWNDQHGQQARPVRITVPFNARQPGDLQAAGNHSRLVTITATPAAARRRHHAASARCGQPGPTGQAAARAPARPSLAQPGCDLVPHRVEAHGRPARSRDSRSSRLRHRDAHQPWQRA